MEEVTDIKAVWFSNMLLLGLDPIHLERKLRIPFNKDMFVLPNKKGFEVVMYFLFEKLNPSHAKEEFRYCFPASDKKQEIEFRKICNDWLMRVSKEETEANLPRIVASIFLSPGGDKFYELLFSFSTYILTKHITQYGVKSRDTLKRLYLTSQTTEMGSVLQSAIRSATVRRRKRFLENADLAVNVYQDWKHFASAEVKKYRASGRRIKDIERRFKSEMEITAEKDASRGSPYTKRGRSSIQEYSSNVQSVKRAQRIQKVRELWKAVDTFHEQRSEERDIVMSVIEGTNEKYKIDSNELDVKIPDLLLRECEKEIHRRCVGNIYQGGKLNINNLLQLWNLSLHLYIEKFHQVGVNSFEDAAPTVTTKLHTHQAHLNNTRSLKTKLSKELLPVLKESVQILKKRLDAHILHARSPGSIRSTVFTPSKSLGLNMLPPTPPVTFMPAEIDHSPIPDTNNIPRKVDNVSTPEAASHLIDVITNKVKGRQSSSLAHGIPVYSWRQQQNSMHNDSVEVERVGNKQRTRIRSVSAVDTNKKYSSSQLQPIKTERRAPSNQEIRQNLRHAKNVKITSSGTQLVEMDKKRSEDAKQSMTEQAVRERPFHVPKSTIGKSIGSPATGKIHNPRVSFVHKPQAHDILADKIVDSILSEGTTDQDLTENITIGKEAFESKDKLARTPEGHPTVPTYPADYNSLLNESLTHMPSPLSSTRIEAVPIDREKAQDLATRLFTENSDDDDEIVTAGPDISPTPPSTRNLSYNNSAARVSLFHQKVANKENVNPIPSVQRLEGDGGPASVGETNVDDIDNEQLMSDIDLIDHVARLEKVVDQKIHDLSIKLMDEVGDDLLARTEAMYEELNQSQTPELPSKRSRSFVSTSRGSTPARTPQKGSTNDSVSPKRSPKMDEIHKSLDQFDDLVQSIQEAASNLSQEVLPGSHVMETPTGVNGDVSDTSHHKILDPESFPIDCDISDDQLNASARIIELENGIFSEFLEVAPNMPRPVTGQSVSFSVRTENSLPERIDVLSQTQPVHQETLGSLDEETESIIERYKRLKLASVSQSADSHDSRVGDRLEDIDEQSPQSPCGTSPLNEKYLQETPNKIKVRRSKKVSLLFDNQPGVPVYGGELNIDATDDIVFKKPKTPPRANRTSSSDSEKLINFSPFSTPTRKSFHDNMGSPMFGLHSVPLSPTTDVLHKETLTPRTQKRRSIFQSILDEDDSVLLPTSPPTANLLDI